MTNSPEIDPRRQDAYQRFTDRLEASRAARTDPASSTLPGEDAASRFATHGDPTLTAAAAREGAGREGVQWVRPTDLAARAGGAVVDRGQLWNQRLHDAALEGIREGRAQLHERLARRQMDLEPVTTTREQAMQPELRRSGVSR